MAPKKKVHYVDNKKFLQALIDYQKAIREAEAQDKEKPRVPTYIADCLMKIAEHLSHKPNFVNYTYREDMIFDGVENSLRYMHNFNAEDYDNPFGYFTKIIWFAFIRRMQKEEKEQYTKYKMIQQMNVSIQTSDKQDHDVVRHAFGDTSIYNDYSQDVVDSFIEKFEEKHKKKEDKDE